MLADDMLQLLTAYVDGECNPRQRHAALRLLHESSEAREILRQLQENLHKLQKLPRRKLEPAFAGTVLTAITERQVLPAKPVPRPAPSLLRWLPVALVGMAAAVLFLVTLGGVLYLALDFGGERGTPKIAEIDHAPVPSPVEPPKTDNNEPKKPTPRPRNPMIAQIIDGTFQQYATHIPDEHRPSSFAFRDLTREPIAKQVAAELKKNNALELEVTVRSNQDAIQRLQRVLKNNNARLVIDPAMIAALNKAGPKAELLVYADNLKADELAKILKELAAEEKKTANPFDTMTVAALSPHEQRHVTELFGEDPTKRVDPNASKNIIGQRPRPKGKVPPRVVAVLPPGPQANASREVREFLLQPVDPGSLRVLVRIRQK